jgi:hypothetical protein
MSLTAALAYARHGIPVLPVHTPDQGGLCSCHRGARCDSPGKHPRLRHGVSEATTDPRRIELWWAHWPRANVGLRTGVVMDVADVDSAEGWHGLRHLLDDEIPPGPQVRTGGGGRHLWFHPTGYGNRVRLLPGLDWRGAGGYVLAPPSRHAAGAGYTWIRRPGASLPTSPPMLRDLIAGPPPPPLRPITHPGAQPGPNPGSQPGTNAGAQPGTNAGAQPGTNAGAHPIAHPDRYAEAALDAETDRVARAAVGCRNDTLNRAAFALGRLVGAGLLEAGSVRRELEAAARWAGLGEHEMRGTIRSGLQAGTRQPFARTPHNAA